MIDNDIAVVEFLENEKFKEKKRKKRTVSKQSQIPVGIKKSKNESTNIETLEIETMEEEDETKQQKVSTFKDSIAQLLSKADSQSVDIFSEISDKKKKQENEEEIKRIRKEEREKRLLAQHRKILKNKDHFVPESAYNEKESILKKITTRGVVKLFNEIRKQQKANEPTVNKEKIVKPVVQKEENTSENKPSWDVLRNDYLMGTKLKDFWNKNDDDKDSDDFSSISSEEDEIEDEDIEEHEIEEEID